MTDPRSAGHSLPPRATLPEADPPEGVAALVREYPGLVLAGGIALGLVAGALLPRQAGRRLSRGASTLAKAAGTAGIALGHDYLDRAEKAARSGSRRIKASSAEAGARASILAHKGNSVARKAGLAIARKALEVAANARR